MGPTDAELIRVWQLRTEGRTVAQVSAELGIPERSVKRYYAKARELLQTVSYLGTRGARRPERQVDRVALREQSVAVIEMTRGWLVDAVRTGTATPVDAAKVVIEGERYLAELLGLKAPVRAELDVTARGGPPVPADFDAEHAVWQYRAAEAERLGLPPPPPPAIEGDVVGEDDDQDDDQRDGPGEW